MLKQLKAQAEILQSSHEQQKAISQLPGQRHCLDPRTATGVDVREFLDHGRGRSNLDPSRDMGSQDAAARLPQRMIRTVGVHEDVGIQDDQSGIRS